jgi:hypothetical protein
LSISLPFAGQQVADWFPFFLNLTVVLLFIITKLLPFFISLTKCKSKMTGRVQGETHHFCQYSVPDGAMAGCNSLSLPGGNNGN